MRILYIANIRIPTEKAHGVAIMKACEAFAQAGAETTLVVPSRRTPFTKSAYDTYGVKKIFSISFLPTLDLIGEKSGRAIFWLQTLTFQLSLIAYLIFRSRRVVIYTRDPAFILLRLLGFKVAFECHLIPNDRGTFFSLVRRASSVLAISEALKRAFIEAGFEAEKILVAPSGVDLSVFDIDTTKEEARKVLDLPPENFLAIYTGNFTTMGKDKGISDIIKSLSETRETTFVAVGGSEKDRERYAQEAREFGVADNVVLRGTTDQKTLALYQKAADVLLMPFPDMPHYRNHMSPVKMFEYMASKRPIIASDLPTICEVLDEETAIIIPPGSPSAIAGALQKVRVDAAGALAENAYKKVISSYSWEKRTERVLKHIS